MKKIFCSIALLTLALSASFATAQHLTATSKPVVIKAIVPEYIGLTAVNTAPVVFDYKLTDDATRDQFARAQSANLDGSYKPTWGLVYNLSHRGVTVCAYASDLINVKGHNGSPDKGNAIGSGFILGRSVQNSGNEGQGSWFGSNASCKAGMGSGAILLDKFTGATSSFTNETGGVRPEGFNLMQMNASSNQDGKKFVPAPGVYIGVMYVVAQAI